MVTEPRIATAPNPCPPGWGLALMATRYDALGMPDSAAHAREMAELSRVAGRSLRDGEAVKVEKGQLSLWDQYLPTTKK